MQGFGGSWRPASSPKLQKVGVATCDESDEGGFRVRKVDLGGKRVDSVVQGLESCEIIHDRAFW